MSIAFLKEHAQKIPAGSPLRARFDKAMEEIAVMEEKLSVSEEVKEQAKTKAKATDK